jgi:hypothetical protein
MHRPSRVSRWPGLCFDRCRHSSYPIAEPEQRSVTMLLAQGFSVAEAQLCSIGSQAPSVRRWLLIVAALGLVISALGRGAALISTSASAIVLLLSCWASLLYMLGYGARFLRAMDNYSNALAKSRDASVSIPSQVLSVFFRGVHARRARGVSDDAFLAADECSNTLWSLVALVGWLYVFSLTTVPDLFVPTCDKMRAFACDTGQAIAYAMGSVARIITFGYLDNLSRLSINDTYWLFGLHTFAFEKLFGACALGTLWFSMQADALGLSPSARKASSVIVILIILAALVGLVAAFPLLGYLMGSR